MKEAPLCNLCGKNHPVDLHSVEETRKKKVADVVQEFTLLQKQNPNLTLELFMSDYLLTAMQDGYQEVIQPQKLSDRDAELFTMGQISGVLKVYYDVRKILEGK